MIEVTIDTGRCEGHGLCEQAAPRVFRLDDDGLVHLVESQIGDDLEAAARAGARMCPVNALRIVEAS